MKHLLNLVFVLISLTKVFAQENRLRSYYVNLPPLIATSIEIGQEFSPKPNRALDVAAGFVINSNHLKSYHKIGTFYESSQRSGLYVRVSRKFIAKSSDSKPAPYFGVFVNNALSYEKGFVFPEDPNAPRTWDGKVKKFSYIGGVGFSLGINPPRNKSFGFEPGIQAGVKLIGGEYDWSKYTPGLGRNLLGFYLQGVLKLRLQKINY